LFLTHNHTRKAWLFCPLPALLSLAFAPFAPLFSSVLMNALFGKKKPTPFAPGAKLPRQTGFAPEPICFALIIGAGPRLGR